MATAAEHTDGRVQRSERSREAIVQALLDLVGDGHLRPTAQQVAAQADVGVRTVFRHFSDMDTLFAAMNERITAEMRPFFIREPQSGSIDDRTAGLLAARFQILERATPYMRSAATQRADSSFLQDQHDRNVRELRADLRRWLPELEAADTAIADALELALSFEAWDRLRTEQRLGVRRARESLTRIVASLVASIPSRD
ncbi:MAG: TetR/AcrR family transcriptional regulator [Myxococcota bacterium]